MSYLSNKEGNINVFMSYKNQCVCEISEWYAWSENESRFITAMNAVCVNVSL